MSNSIGKVHVSLVPAKTKVSLIKWLTIQRLKCCGAHLLAKVLHHAKWVLEIPSMSVFALTDSTIVLDCLKGNPRWFKQFIGNWISVIMDLIPPEKWSHVNGVDNPADCASRGIFSAELMTALKKCVIIQLVKCYHLSSHWIVIFISTIWSELQCGWFVSSIIVERRVPLQIVCQLRN